MDAPHFITADDHDDLACVVARIRARGVQQPLPTPEDEAIASVIAHIHDEEPLRATELAEHERLWRLNEDETRAREQANDRAEGLL